MKINYIDYYTNIAKLEIKQQTNTEMRCLCPFHKDEVVSFSVNIENGLWKCFSASCKAHNGGNIFQFHNMMFKIPLDKTEKDIFIKLGYLKVLKPTLIEKHHQLLLKSKTMMAFLKEKRGYTLETIKKRKLGCDADRIWIPIYDEDGYIVNVRKYLPEFKRKKKTDIKIISYAEGYGDARLYPIENALNKQSKIIFEGEMDTLLADQLGYNCVTVTSGAGSWKDSFTKHFKKCDTYICYDVNDKKDAGQVGAKKIAKVLSSVTSVGRIVLPLTEPVGADFTNYIIDQGYSKKDFDELINVTELKGAKEKKDDFKDQKFHKVSLYEAVKDKYYYKKVETNVIVSGKDLAPYFAPTKIELTCDDVGHSRACKTCGLGHNGGKMTIEFTPDNQDLLHLINCSDFQQRALIRYKAGIGKCSSYETNIKEVANIEEIRVIPEIDYSTHDVEYVTRQLFYIGHGIKTNRSYIMKGTTLPEPRTQYVTQLITDAQPTQTSIDQFTMTPRTKKQLAVFQSDNCEDKINDIATDLTYNVTKIYCREDLITAIDLIYHSVINFYFQGDFVKKGWCEGLVIGDTRCGKTETVQKLIGHYKLGEMCSSENMSYAGLIGGMQQTQKRWSISWGKIPLNDRRLVGLDEISTMDVDFIGSMSGVRSSGIAEITKINTEKTNARTRQIWISNPRSGRKLDTYNYGVYAIKELIGRVEDIARFDLAVTAASDEVKLDVINAASHEKIKHVYTSELCNTLLLWVWSRKPEQVKFTADAEKLILEKALQFGNTYCPTIPIVEANEQRIKLARLSVAAAARTFSTDDGENIVVRSQHVEFVAKFLTCIFSKPSMGYDVASAAYKQGANLTNFKCQRLEKEFKQFSDYLVLRELLLEHQTFRKMELIDQMGYDVEEARRLFKWMNRNKLTKSTSTGYIKQPVFTNFLKRFENKEEQ